MIPLPLDELAKALGAERPAGACVVGLKTDSRRVVPGDCFFALPGTRAHGDQFIQEALGRGALLAVAGASYPAEARVIPVADPLLALGRAAALVRRRFHGPVVGITGSVGKTTVKEFLRALLSPHRRTVVPEGSFNNFEGVPRTLAALEEDTEILVAEMGTNAPGEIAALCALARPTLGVLTAIGPAHLEGLGSIEGVLEEKLSLARSLPEGAPLFLNADDPVLSRARLPDHVVPVWVGLLERPGVKAPTVRPGVLEGEGLSIHHPFTSEVQIRNLWLALQVAQHLGLSAAELAASAKTLAAPRLRGETRTIGCCTVIVDCYNANPLSMTEALRDLARRPAPRYAVLGEMLELGAKAASHHAELGSLLPSLGLEGVLFAGPSWQHVRAAALAAGLDDARFFGAPTREELRERFSVLLAGSGTVLVKASRGIALEKLLEDRLA